MELIYTITRSVWKWYSFYIIQHVPLFKIFQHHLNLPCSVFILEPFSKILGFCYLTSGLSLPFSQVISLALDRVSTCLLPELNWGTEWICDDFIRKGGRLWWISFVGIYLVPTIFAITIALRMIVALSVGSLDMFCLFWKWFLYPLSLWCLWRAEAALLYELSIYVAWICLLLFGLVWSL